VLANEFEYFEPRTAEEALSLLDKYGKEASILAGGTDLLVSMKKGDIEPKLLINILGIGDLSYIIENAGLRIGAATPLRSIEKSKMIEERYQALHEAVRALGKVQVRNMGTIGGNICNASPAADTAPALLALSATVKISCSRGDRIVPLEGFFKSPGETILLSNELLTEIKIPSLPKTSGSAFLKVSRVSADLAKVNCAAFVERSGDTCESCRIALGAVAPTPVRVRRAEDVLNGEKFDVSSVRAAALVARDEIKPITDARSTADYRREVSKVLVEETLKIAWKRAGGRTE
jgi:carbon-monoxide dehydrogenase medium subunit